RDALPRPPPFPAAVPSDARAALSGAAGGGNGRSVQIAAVAPDGREAGAADRPRPLGARVTSSSASSAAAPGRAAAAAIQDDLVRLRRSLHREPELGLELPLTQAKVLGALRGLPVEVATGTALSSVTAVLRGGRPGPAVLLRGDMDALPVHEETGLEYASRFPGRMHACGHDLHTAVLVGAVRLLAERRAELPGDVVFMFQPGEEDGGGARLMIDEGVLDAAGARPAAAYALHVGSAGRRGGVFACRGGTAMASADRLSVEVHGRGGHGSAPHTALDPVPAACEMVTAL